LRKDGDCNSGHLLLYAELQVEQTKRAVVGGVCDHERRSRTRAPLLLCPGNAVALSIRGERLVVQSPLRLGVARGLSDDRHVGISPHPQDDLPITERIVRRLERASWQAANASNALAILRVHEDCPEELAHLRTTLQERVRLDGSERAERRRTPTSANPAEARGGGR